MVIIYDIEQDALALCEKLIPCKSAKDLKYSEPIKKSDAEQWAVQVLDSDIKHLTVEEFGKMVELPNDWFDQELI